MFYQKCFFAHKISNGNDALSMLYKVDLLMLRQMFFVYFEGWYVRPLLNNKKEIHP